MLARAIAVRIKLAVVIVDEIVFAGHVMRLDAGFADDLAASSNCEANDSWVMSPVWIMKAGLTGRAFILPIPSFKVSMAWGLAALLKPT